RIGLEILLETGPLADHRRVDLELVGQMTADQGQDFLAGHDWLGTVERSSDDASGRARRAPAASSAPCVRPTMSPETPRAASRIACDQPKRVKRPCGTTLSWRSPSRNAPPRPSGPKSRGRPR